MADEIGNKVNFTALVELEKRKQREHRASEKNGGGEISCEIAKSEYSMS